MRTALVFAWQGFSTCIHFLEVATLKVFTSIFVLEGVHTTLGDAEEGFRRDLVLSTEDELVEVSRRHVMNLHIDKEVRNQTGGRA